MAEGQVDVDVLLAMLKRHAQVGFTMEGPYVKFGMPVGVIATRDGTHWDFRFDEAGDGVGPSYVSTRRVEEGKLREYVEKLLAPGCPVLHLVVLQHTRDNGPA